MGWWGGGGVGWEQRTRKGRVALLELLRAETLTLADEDKRMWQV